MILNQEEHLNYLVHKCRNANTYRREPQGPLLEIWPGDVSSLLREEEWERYELYRAGTMV